MFATAIQKLTLHWSRKVLTRFTRDASAQDLPLTLMVPLAPKDVARARMSIPLMQERIAHPVERTVVVAPDHAEIRTLCAELGLEFVGETEQLEALLGSDYELTRGWLRQQFLKLNACRWLDAEHVLVIDSDTYPLRPTAFTDGARHILYRGDPNKEPFRKFTQTLLGHLSAQPPNFVAHCMLFHRPWVDELFAEIEARHDTSWAKAMFTLTQNPANGMMSEYDIYGCFLAQTRPDAFTQTYYAGIKAPSVEFLAERPLPAWKHRFRFLSNHERG
ncbi:MAG: DUF6492 family protein [Paracoccaceae bacterium]